MVRRVDTTKISPPTNGRQAHREQRRANQRRVLEVLMRVHRASRSQIARISGISPPTVGRVVDNLLADGVLTESFLPETPTTDGEARADDAVGPGRPSQALELDAVTPRFLAIQIGAAVTRVTRAPFGPPVEDRFELEFPTTASANTWSRRLAAEVTRLPMRRLHAVVVSVPGVLEERAGRVLRSPNLRWTEAADLRRMIQEVVSSNADVIFVQEIRALALGHLHAASDARSFLLVDFGTGVGAAAVIDGHLYSGQLPLSGELGHTPVPGNTRRCGCGAVGCVETLISRAGLLATAQEHFSLERWEDLVNLLHQRPIPSSLKKTLDITATAIATSLNVMGLQHVVMTGAISELPASVSDYLSDAIRSKAMWARFGEVSCTTAPRRRLAGMVSVAFAQTQLAQR